MVNHSPDDTSPIFIVGSPRSGTSLLRMMLTSHPRIAIPPESHFIPLLIHRFGKGPYTSDDIDLTLDLLRTSEHFKYWQVPLDNIREQLLRARPKTVSELIEQIYMVYASQYGQKTRWGDKTPAYVYYLDFLLKLFPHSQVIHVIRDSRDVSLSLQNFHWGGGSVLTSSLIWRSTTNTALSRKSSLGSSQYFEVRYEDLVQYPKKMLSRLCSYLREEYSDEMLNYASYNIPRIRGLPFKPVTTIRLQAWRREMSHRDTAITQYATRPLLSSLGYQTVDIHLPLHVRLWIQCACFWGDIITSLITSLPLMLRIRVIHIFAHISSLRFRYTRGLLFDKQWKQKIIPPRVNVPKP